jgi:hypothetical protein
MKGFKKLETFPKSIEGLTKAINGKIELVKQQVALFEGVIESLTVALTEAREENELLKAELAGRKADITLDGMYEAFVREVLQPVVNPKNAANTPSIISAFYAYCQDRKTEIRVPTPKVTTALRDAMLRVHASTMMWYTPECLVRRLPFSLEGMASERGQTVEELINDTTVDWKGLSMVIPWWQCRGKEQVTLNGAYYYLR